MNAPASSSVANGSRMAKSLSRPPRIASGRGTPARTLTAEELATELRLPERVVLAMLESRAGTFFPGAVYRPGDGGWMIPERAVLRYLSRARMEPLFTLREAADFLGLHYQTLFRGAEAWRKGDPDGFETVELLLPSNGEPRRHRERRITLSELLRHCRRTRRAGTA